MKLYCIVENIEKEVGFKLAGLDGCTLNSQEKINEKIDDIVSKSDIGVLVITSTIYNYSKEKIDKIRKENRYPLFVII